MASSPDGRSQFARSAVQLVRDCGFDGIDIDWEYPADDGQAQNFVDLLRELRAQLDAYSAQAAGGYRFLITVACPAGPSNYQKLRIRDMDRYLDFWNLMAYDMAGSWDQTAGHQANIYKSMSKPAATPFCADDAINYYIANGLPANKLVLGMPIYGRAFLNTDGPGSPYNGVGAPQQPGSWEAGVWDYKALPRPGATELFDPNIIASWSYDNGQRMMVTYDTVECERKKCEYIRKKQLGGAMWWETSGDRKDDHSLIATVASSLGGGDYNSLDKADNCLSYPWSKYDNLRNGFPNN
jgi:chitinase